MRRLAGRAAYALVGTCTAAAAGARVCIEEAPGSTGRQRLRPLPAWAAERFGGAAPVQPTGDELARLLDPDFMQHFISQWGPQRLPVPPPGQVDVRWCAGCCSGPDELPAEARQAVDLAASQLAVALGSLDVGDKTGSGWHIEVVPSQHFYVGTRHRCIVLTTGAATACWRLAAGSGGPEGRAGGTAAGSSRSEGSTGAHAALLWLLGHELAHGLAHHTSEKVVQYVSQMVLYCWRCFVTDWGYVFRCLLGKGAGPDGRGTPSWPQPAQRVAALEPPSVNLKLRFAASLQRLSWHHEWEADAVACQVLAAAGVPAQLWAEGLAVLQRVAALERQGSSSGGSASGGVELATVRHTIEDEQDGEEAAAYLAAAEWLAREARSCLAAGQATAAQQLMDDRLRWPLPAGWLSGMGVADQVQLLCSVLQTHPPLGDRAARVRQLAAPASWH